MRLAVYAFAVIACAQKWGADAAPTAPAVESMMSTCRLIVLGLLVSMCVGCYAAADKMHKFRELQQTIPEAELWEIQAQLPPTFLERFAQQLNAFVTFAMMVFVGV